MPKYSRVLDLIADSSFSREFANLLREHVPTRARAPLYREARVSARIMCSYISHSKSFSATRYTVTMTTYHASLAVNVARVASY